MNHAITLLIPEKSDIELDQIAAAWRDKGFPVKRPGKYWIRDESLTQLPLAVYGNQAFALVVAQLYNIDLVSVDDAMIVRLDRQWTKRSIHLKTIGQITAADFPTFIKPVFPKIFIAKVFHTQADFAAATTGLRNEEQILQSNVIADIIAEARCYTMNKALYDIALYEGSADLESGAAFAHAVMESNDIPSPVVIDIAYSRTLGWFVLEFNACWGAGLNNCRAEKVVDCIVHASVR